ncbi:hypothetical protein MMB17_05580 [Methylobacterium organophilum]|uniref:hypothetical protein n=1 Tax=Methylobacterium organophilum TaxID=410 RepID=UPI001F13F38C|nr:hypothetical protein [Methylobacterium organophilum]UMY18787.1 hypothetical protein MMB17_05580 [Methylobacterium organophilum]
MRDTLSSIDRNVYVTPDPVAVAKLFESHGAEAAESRWHWIEPRTLAGLARIGRSLQGQGPTTRRERSTTALEEAIAVEAAYALGSAAAGERAAGIRNNAILPVAQERGLVDVPRCSSEARGLAVSLTSRAGRGDLAAAARIEALRDHERAVADVLRIALGLVPEQPPRGRYVLPEPSAELADALGECQREAVIAVFPALAGAPFDPAPAAPEEEPAAMPETETTPDARRGRERRVPGDAEIRAAHAETPRAPELAVRWGVSTAAVYTHLRRLGLTRPRRIEAVGEFLPEAPPSDLPQTNVVPFLAPVAADSRDEDEGGLSLYCEPDPDGVAFRGRLDVEGLALAVELARRTGLAPQAAISWVRADLAEAALANGRVA